MTTKGKGTTKERRRNQRRKKMSMVNFSIPGKVKETYGILRDLGPGGMQISFNKKLDIGQRIDFLQTDALPCGYGLVKWCHPRDGLFLIGIEFAEALQIQIRSKIFTAAEKK